MRRDTTSLTVTNNGHLTQEEAQLVGALIVAYRPNHYVMVGRGGTFDIAAAHATAGGDFDLVLLTMWEPPTLANLLPYLEESAYILVHEAANHRVAAVIDATLAAHADELVDCGMISRTAKWDTHHQWHTGGLRLLRYVRRRRLTVWQEGA